MVHARNFLYEQKSVESHLEINNFHVQKHKSVFSDSYSNVFNQYGDNIYKSLHRQWNIGICAVFINLCISRLLRFNGIFIL